MKEKIRLSKPNIVNQKKIIHFFKNLLNTGYFVQGKYVSLFEKKIAEYLEIKHAIAVSSGTAALHLSLIAAGVNKDDEVIVPAYTFPATANVVELIGAKPILVDVDIDSYNIQVDLIKKFISKKTKAIIPVHLFGNPANMQEIIQIAKEYNLFVIEDAAGALGSIYRGKKCGTIGHCGCFSFHPRKIISTGEGGMIVTNKDDFAEKILMLRNHGLYKLNSKFDIFLPGFNYRMNEFEAILGIVQMEKIKKLIKERNRIAQLYLKELKDIENIKFQKISKDCTSSWQAFVIHVTNKKNFNYVFEKLFEKGIEVTIGTYAIHLLKYYSKKYNLASSDYPVAAELYHNSMALPFFNGMKKTELNKVIKILKETLNEF